jgi:hypothetical protein
MGEQGSRLNETEANVRGRQGLVDVTIRSRGGPENEVKSGTVAVKALTVQLDR